MEKSLVMIKPDGVERGLVGEIIKRFELRGVQIRDIKLVNPSLDIVTDHYREHIGKVFFQELVDYIMEGPVVVFVIEGDNAVLMARSMIGNKDPIKAQPGTIRGDFASSITRNIVHASDGVEAAEREINIWL